MERFATIVGENGMHYTVIFQYIEHEDEVEIEILLEEALAEAPKVTRKGWTKQLGGCEKLQAGHELIGTDCVICLAPYKEREFKRTLSACSHTFHKKCIDKWLWQTRQTGGCPKCPMCRAVYM